MRIFISTKFFLHFPEKKFLMPLESTVNQY
jgi:hypothetical protein